SPTGSSRGQSAISGPIDTALLQQQIQQQQQLLQSRSAQEQPQQQQQYPSRTSSSRQASVPLAADTSSTSISSIHSYSSLNSNGGPRDIREGPSIISNSILNSSVNQSIGNATIGGGGGLNSNNSFFTVKQSNNPNTSRGIGSNGSSSGSLGTNSNYIPGGNASSQPDRVPHGNNSNASSPASSGSIVRPPMSSQRSHHSNTSSTSTSPTRNPGHSQHTHMNASFSSVGSSEGVIGVSINGGSTLSQDGGSQPAVSLSASYSSSSHSTVVASGSASNQSSAQPTVAPTHTSTPPVTVTPSQSQRRPSQSQSQSQSPPEPQSQSQSQSLSQTQTQSQSQAPSQTQPSTRSSGNAAGNSRSTQGPSQSNGTHVPNTTTSTQPKKHRNKGDSHAQRPSATVGPAPTPAMHWTRAKVHGQIPPKDLRAQTVNLVGESVYVFGGCDSKTCYNTLYIFDADTMHWTQPKTYGSIPPPCRAHSSTLVDNKRLYVFGGGDGPQYFNELYMLDTDTLTWTNPQTTGTRPCRRRAHTTCVYNNCIYVFGGGDGVQALNDTYVLNLSDMHWSELKTTGTVPISRGYHTSNLIKSQFIVYGGSDGHECFSDVHVLDLETREWTKIDINRALPRLSHTSTQVGSYLFVVGGHDGSRYSCDVVMLNLVTWSWETRKVFGIPPAGRGYHASLLYDSRLFMFGGYDGQTVFDDIYILDLSTCAYLPQITDFQVRVVERRETGKMYALKYISKAQVIKMDAVRNILRERQILERLDHVFLVNMRFAFQDDEYMYMCMDLMMGGDLRFHTNRKSFGEDVVRFWIAEMCSAINHLHSLGIVHRDIKPDNILLDANGHAHLTDFNIGCKLTEEKPILTSQSGTVAYMAPEVFKGTGYGTSVDWWALGVVFYECIYGQRPFRTENVADLKIAIGNHTVEYPSKENVSRECISLIQEVRSS
ncbi:hypothetical protein BG004_006363, partial [Podila humilis]